MSFIEKQIKTRPSLAISKMMGIGRDLPPAQECKCDMTTKLVGDGCMHCNPEYTTDHEAQPASDYRAERDALAQAIANMAVKIGIITGDMPLTGPQLVMLCDDVAKPASAPSEQKLFDSIDEAIEHAIEVSDREGCSDCGGQHRQLAGWLVELRGMRNNAPQSDYKAQRDALLDFANHLATSPKLVGTGWQEMAQAVVASVKGGTK